MDKKECTVRRKNLSGRETLHRMNYLYQIAEVCRKMDGERGRRLMCLYGSQLRSLGKKTMFRMDIEMKRKLCKGCQGLVEPGDTGKVYLERGLLVTQCLICGKKKRVPTRRDYAPWPCTPGALVETFRDEALPHDTKRIPHREGLETHCNIGCTKVQLTRQDCKPDILVKTKEEPPLQDIPPPPQETQENKK